MVAGQLENKPLLTANNHLYRALKDKGYKNPLVKSFKTVMIACDGEKSYLMD